MFKKEKIYYLAIIWLSLFMLGATPVFATNSISIEFGEVDTDNQTIPILYNSTGDVTGFQFFILGIDVISVYGGLAEENNFYLHQGSTCWRDNDCKDFVTGFSTSGLSIPPGSDTLFYLNYAEIGDEFFDENISITGLTCLDITEGFILGPQGSTFEVDLGECMVSPVDCNGDFYGSAYDDECGICSGGNSDHNANSDMDCAGICFGDAYIDDCGVCDDNASNDCFTLSIDLSAGANLISFRALPTDRSLASIFSNLNNNINLIMTEGSGAMNMDGIWYGSLYEITPDNGYWVIMNTDEILTIPEAVPSSFEGYDLQYQLHAGNNLISYPFATDQAIDDAISSEYDNSIWAVAGSGIAAININGSWHGSLEYLHSDAGYWIVSYGDTQFQFNQPDNDSSSRNNSDSRTDAPDLFTFSQSTYQAFYWTYHADIDSTPLVVGEDWIGAFYGDECVGARIWSGLSTLGIPTDIPVMGYADDIVATQNYITSGEYPRFVIYDASAETYYDAKAYDNHIFEGALLAMYSVNTITVERDCADELGGDAVEDNCGICDNDPENDCADDCNGEFGGPDGIPDNGDEAFYDNCGICSSGNTEHVANSDQDDCGDCFGNNEAIDCNGDCDGTAFIDDCSVCSGGYTGHLINSDQDCNGDCFGGALEDSCGVCSGGNSGHGADSDQDCNGDCDGTAFIDDCSVCSGGYTGHLINSDQDCNGDCFGGALEDSCGVCSGGNSGHGADSDIDCNGDCFGGALEDSCGVCSGGNSGHGADSDQDCNGDCFGSAVIETYYYDYDNDNLGSDTSQEFCNTNIPQAWVSNSDDEDDNCPCEENDESCHDCMGVCDGSDDITTYYQDNDSDGLGNDVSEEYCSGDVPPGWADNSDDEDDDCYSNIHDCAGVCDGDATIDPYWYDQDEDGLGSGNSQDFCSTDIDAGWVNNNNDLDDSCFSNIHDCADVCNGDAFIQTYWYDSDGDGLGGESSENICTADVPFGWVLNNEDVDDYCYSNYHDCAGVCNGFAQVNTYCMDADDDGLGNPDTETGYCNTSVEDGWVEDCSDADDGCSSNYHDCDGICDGPVLLDNCDTCDSDPENDCVQDCAGTWGGDLVDDECGICGGDSTSCADCAGTPNGDAEEDNCGTCDSDMSNDCVQDCAGEWGGSLVYDECGICAGDNTSCADCAGTPNGDAVEDNCGTCDSDMSNDCVQDCAGEWGGDAEVADFYYDLDGDGLGAGSSVSLCDAYVPSIMVANNDDSDDDCYSNYHDCLGDCDGVALVDDCGVCDGGNADQDCTGQCFGDNELDNCGICDNDPENDCSDDCNGVPGGDNELDNCGTCDSDSSNDCLQDCAGTWGGNLVYDECGICDGLGPSTWYVDADVDGLGDNSSDTVVLCDQPDGYVDNDSDPYPGCTSNYLDECNVCDGNNSTCADCAGTPNGEAIIDDCGVCSDGNSGHQFNSDIDNCGDCFGNNEAQQGCGCDIAPPGDYWYDFDNDGMGSCTLDEYDNCLSCEEDPNCESFCASGVPNDNWADNYDDDDDHCSSNYHDCMGVCDGSDEITIYYQDNDGDGLGNDISEEFCSGDVPQGWVENIDDEDDNCISNNHDCSGICDGDAQVITYCEDADGDGLGNQGTETEYCDALVENGWVTDCSDEDDDCYSNYHDCDGVCNGSSQMQTYYFDGDGDGLGDGLEQEFCSADEISDDWVFNNDDEDDDCYSNYHDCDGVCDGGAFDGTWYADTDGDGLGDAVVTWDGCSAEIPDGFVADNTDEDDDCFSNYHDCSGICDGDAFDGTWYADTDGDGLGDAAVTWDGCSTEVPDGFVADNTDEDDDCFSNYHDCSGICDGDAQVITYCEDADGDGLGNQGTETEYCDALVENGWVTDCSDEDDDCYSNYHDCDGVCDGGAFNGTWYVDTDGDGLGDAAVTWDGCSAEVPDGFVADNTDEDDDCFSNYHDCLGVCDGGAFDGTWYVDTDGDGLGDAAVTWDGCSTEVPNGFVADNTDEDDDCFSNDIDGCGVCDGNNSSCSGCADEDAFNFSCHAEEIPPCNDDITIDDGSCIYYPEEFQFNQSQMQAFYIVENADIQQDEIKDLEILTDWIGVFKDSVCVGAYPWVGNGTTIPTMGYDGTSLTENYLLTGDYPTFHIYDALENEYMNTEVDITSISGSEYTGWTNFSFYFIEEMHGLGPDCSGMELGSAFIDDCGICVCGYLPSDETLFGCYEGIPNEDLDCDGVCDPETPVGSEQAEEGLGYGAFLDNCGVCSEGGTDHVADSDDGGCGCFNPAPEDYWLDVDSDGFGSGNDSFEICLDNVTELYANNNLDPEPNCPNPDIETLMIDDCGDCIGVDVSSENQNMDNNGVCCAASQKDSCDICFGDNSSCNKPVVDAQSINILEDQDIEIILTGSDPNNDNITFAIAEEPVNGILNEDEESWTYQPNLNYHGTDVFTFTATDGNWTSDPAAVTINIQSVNDMPTVEDMFITSPEDSTISINLLGNDVDGDVLSYSIVNNPAHGSLFPEGGDLYVYTPDPDYYGLDSMLYTVSDSQYTSSVGIVNLNITSIFDPPYLSSIPDTSIIEGETFTYNLTAGDVDGDELNYFVNTDVNSEASVAYGILNVIPQYDFYGEIEVTVTVSDGVYDVSQSFILTVISVNDSPVISPISDQSILEDTELIIEIIVSDPDGDELTLTAENTGNASVNITGDQLNLTPEVNFTGEFDVMIIVDDGELSDSTEFIVSILPVNDPPELIGDIEDITVLESSEDIEIQLSDIFFDVENGSDLLYSISENVEGLNVNIIDTVLTLSFVEGVSGSGTVEITASDNISRATVSTSFNVEIIPVNDPPVVNTVSIELYEDTEIEFTLSAQDPEGDTLSYSIVNNPTYGSLLSGEGNVYVYDPNPDYYGTDSFIFSVSDGENQVETTAGIVVLSVNDAPYFISDSLPDALENNVYEVEIQIGDVDNSQNELILSIVNAPIWLESDGFLLSGIPGSNNAGMYDVTLELTDSLITISQTMSLYVENSNSAPLVEDLYINVEEDSFVELTLFASDPEGSSLTYNFTTPLNGVISGSTPNLIYTPNPDYFGDDSFTYSASDGDMESDTATVYINVLGVNDNPTSTDMTFEVDSTYFIVDFNSMVNDPDGDQLTILTVPPSSGETLSTLFGGTLSPMGDLLYEYNPPNSDADFMLYKATDGISETELSIITFNLFDRTWSRLFPPTAFDDEVNMAEDEIKEITLVGFDVFYDFPLDGSEEIIITQQPEHGNLGDITLSSSSSNQLAQWTINYIPDLNFNGSDIIKYKVINPNNDNGESEEATISINITPVNDLPQLNSISDIEINEDSFSEFSITGFDPDNSLEYSAISSNENIEVFIDNSTISINPQSDYNGSGSITITATEIGGDELSISQIVTVDVLPVNDAPALTDINAITFNEDESITVSLSATDVDYVSFDYSASSVSEDLNISISGNLLILTGNTNSSGSGNITVTVADNEGAEDSQDVPFSILPINDPPILGELSDLTIPEDSLAVITLSATDIDSNELIFSAIGSEHVIVDINNNILSITPEANWSGTENITISVSDGEFIDSSERIITIYEVNDPPVMTAVSNQSVEEDNSLDIFLNAVDSDSDYLIYSVIESGGMTSSLSTNILSITPPLNYFGQTSITVSVSDGEYVDSTDFTLTVNAVNDAPIVLQPLEDISLLEDSGAATMVLSSYFGDVDDDSLYYSVNLNISGLVTMHIIGDTLNINTIENQFGGPIIATVIATDQMSSTPASDNLEITVIGVNDPPVLSAIDEQEMDEDGIFIYSLNGTDPDGDQLSFSAQMDYTIGSLSIDGNLLKIIPIANYNGNLQVTASVSDGEYVDSTDFTLTVNAVNDAPIVSYPLGNINLLEDSEDTTMVLSSHFGDVDGDSLVYDVSFNSEDMLIAEVIGDTLIISTLQDQFGGPVEITVTASDQNDAVPAVDIFDVTIEAVNDPPLIVSVPDSTAWEDIEYVYQIEVEDVDNDLFYYEIAPFHSIPDGMIIDSSGIITWTPGEGVLSSGSIVLYVWDTEDPSDGIDSPDLQEFVIDVIPVNDSPEIISIAPPAATEDILYTYQVEVEDPDDNEFNYDLMNEPTGMVIDSTGLISWTPLEGIESSGAVTVVVTDGGEDDVIPTEQEFFIVVIPVNDPPTIISIPPITEIMVFDTFYYQIVVEDIDDDEFNFVLQDAPEGMAVDSTGLIYWIPQFPGDYGPITILASDGGEDEVESAVQEIFILVTPFIEQIDYCLELHSGVNLKSFYALPEDASVANIMSALGDTVVGIITEGGGAIQITPGNWVGTLTSFNGSKGYWIIVNNDVDLCLNNAYLVGSDTEYNLHYGANLISFPSAGSVDISDALPDDIEIFIVGIITEGGGAIQIAPGNWVGTLTSFTGSEGYWMISSNPITFAYDLSTLSRTANSDIQGLLVPGNYQVQQSTRQAFYFVEGIIVNGEPISNEDWVLIYHGTTLIGVRQWKGPYTDVPAMGNDGRLETDGYSENGSKSTLKILQGSTGDIFHIYDDIPEWIDNGLIILGNLIAHEIPSSFKLGNPYPNPFNPVTNIVYDVPNDCNIELSVYDLKGRLVDQLISGYIEAGSYEIRWHAEAAASGVYFFRMVTPEKAITQKMILMK